MKIGSNNFNGELDCFGMLTKRPLSLTPIAEVIRAGVLGLGLGLMCNTGYAMNIGVADNSDDVNSQKCTLRKALVSLSTQVLSNDCNLTQGNFGNNDTIFFDDLPSNTITLSQGELVVAAGNSITITGSSVNDLTIDAGSNSRVIRVDSATLNIESLTITGGRAIGDFGRGAGVYAESASNVTISDSTISGNSASNGAAVSARDLSAVTINDSQLVGNSGSYAGAVDVYNSTVTINNSQISNNSTTQSSGAIQGSTGYISIINSQVFNNTAPRGGGLYLSGGLAGVSNSSISNNTSGTGGGIFITNGVELVISDSDVTGNMANNGSGIYAKSNAVLTLNRSTVSGNSNSSSSASNGGGLFLRESSATINDSTLSNNSSANRGGAIYTRGASEVSLNNSTISGNSAASGAGVYVNGSSFTISNTTVVDNSSPDSAVSFAGSFLYISNSIIANTVSSSDCRRIMSNVTLDAQSIIGDGSCGGTALTVGLQLGPLADNGGPTQTHALLEGSPARDRGDLITCTQFDQRGNMRNDGDEKCDIGALEYNSDDVGSDTDSFYVIPLGNDKAVVIPL